MRAEQTTGERQSYTAGGKRYVPARACAERIRFEVTRRGHFKALFKEASDGTLRGVIGDYFIWVLGE